MSEEKKLSAVEWLAEKYNYVTWMRNRDEISAGLADEWRKHYLEQAKEMEKKQIMEQTAVEFLYDAIDNELIDFLENRIDIHELSVAMLEAKYKAKEMEKGQIMKAVYDSMGTNFDPNMGRAELYYNEKYGK